MYLLLCLHYCLICVSYVLTHHYIIAVNDSFALNTIHIQLMTFFFF